MTEDFDRSFSGYLHSLSSSPGFAWRAGAGLAFGLSLFLSKGIRTLAVVVLAVGLVALLVVYPIYRRRGPGPF